MVSSLVIAEHGAGSLAPSTLHAIGAATSLGEPVTCLVAGKDVTPLADSLSRVHGVGQVLYAETASLAASSAEPYSELIKALHQRCQFSHIFAPASTFGKDLLPRAAALLGVQPVSDITAILAQDTFVRPIYAGNAIATVKCTRGGPYVISVRTTAFEAAQQQGGTAGVESVQPQELAAAEGCPILTEVLSEEAAASSRPELSTAKRVVSGGRALQTKENFAMLEGLADKLGAALGATRAAVDAGMVPNDMQVGQTGKVVAPELYLALGLSGAIQHLAGMKDSKTIVAINTDPDAPIFQVADYGLVQDLFTAIPELEAELDRLK